MLVYVISAVITFFLVRFVWRKVCVYCRSGFGVTDEDVRDASNLLNPLCGVRKMEEETEGSD